MDKKPLEIIRKFEFSFGKYIEMAVVSLLCALLVIVPFFRGLYFREDYLRSIICVGIIFVLYVIDKSIRKDKQFFSSYLDILILLLPIVYAISFLFAVNVKNAFDVLLKYVSYFMIYKIASDCCSSGKSYKFMRSAIILSTYIVSITGLLVLAGKLHIDGAVIDMRIYGLYQYPNTTASAIGVGILITIGCLIKEKKMPLALLYQIILSTLLAGFLLTLSWGSFFVLAVLLIFYFIITNYENKVSFIVAIIISIVSNGLIFIDYYKNALKTNFIVYYLISIMIGLLLQFVYFKINKYFSNNMKHSTILLTSVGMVIIAVSSGFILLNHLGLLNVLTFEKLWNVQQKLQNASDRIVFVKDGLKIFADNFLLGIGGGGWSDVYQKYQSFQYTSREAHNFYIQIMTETGILGTLVLTGIVIYIVRSFVLAVKSKNNDIIPIYMGMFMILGHAWLDFDLSYAALSFLLWSLVGMGSQKDNLKAWKLNENVLLKFVFALAGVMIIWASTSMFVGMSYGNRAAKLVNSDTNKAIPMYEKAMSLDKYNAAYRLDYAQIMSTKYKSEKDKIYYEKLVDSLNQITKYEPKNELYIPTTISVYLNNGMIDQGVTIANNIVILQPLNANAYLIKLQVNYEVAKYYFSISQHDKAIPYLENMIDTEKELERAKNRSTKPFDADKKVYDLIGLAQNWKINAERVIEEKTK